MRLRLRQAGRKRPDEHQRNRSQTHDILDATDRRQGRAGLWQVNRRRCKASARSCKGAGRSLDRRVRLDAVTVIYLFVIASEFSEKWIPLFGPMR